MDESPKTIAAALEAAGKLIETLGFSGFLLVFLLVAVKFLGSPATQDRFLRSLLWADEGPAIMIAVLVLVLATVANLMQRKARNADYEKEIQRLTGERNSWQERALKVELAHSSGKRGQG